LITQFTVAENAVVVCAFVETCC